MKELPLFLTLAIALASSAAQAEATDPPPVSTRNAGASRRRATLAQAALAGALGAITGPLSYLAGERLGALEVSAGPVPIAALAAVWAAALPLLAFSRDFRFTPPASNAGP